MADSIKQALAELHRELEETEAKLVHLNALHTRRLALRDAIAVLEKLEAPKGETLAERRAWEVAKEVLLSHANRPMAAGELLLRLRGMGVKFEGKTPVESLRTSLLRKPEIFARVNGKFILKPEVTQK